MKVIPLGEDAINDRQLPAELFQSYARLLGHAWDGHGVQTVALSLADLRALWGNAARELSERTVFRYLSRLQSQRLIAYTVQRDGRYQITFPRAAGLTDKNGSEGRGVAQNGSPLTNLAVHCQKWQATDKNGSEPMSMEETPPAQRVTDKNGSERPPESQRFNSPPLTPPPFDAKFVLAANLPAPQLKALYQEALTAGHVFPQFIAAWSRALTEEGPDYLPHLLGHIAYAYSPACDYDKPGAYVKEMAAERLPAPAEFLPPAGLNFAGALAWALRGGRAEELPAPAASKPDPASEPAMPDPALDAPWEGCAQSPRQIWQTACRQLQLELNKSVYDTWVRSVAALPPEDGVFVLGVSHTYAKDWLENRLLETLKRVVSGVVGRGVEVRLALLKEVCL